MPQGRPATWADVIRAEAEALKITPDLAVALAEQESGLRQDRLGSAGEIGLFQIRPATAQELGIDATDPYQNIRGGLRYLRQHLDKYEGDVQKALAAYNMGPTAYERSGGQPYPQTATYVRSVLGRLARPRPAATALQTPATMTPAVSHEVGAPPPEPGLLRKLTQGFDPRTREGRRNIAGGLGAIGGAMLTSPTAAVSGPVGPATGAALGAMLAGGAVEAGERFLGGFVGTPPPLRESIGAVGAAMTEQGMYEMGGRAIVWPFRLVGRRLAATSVARQAKEYLRTTRVATERGLRDLVWGAADAVKNARQAAKSAVEQTTERLRPRVRGVERAAEASLRGAEQVAEAARLAPQTAYGQLVGVPPTLAGRTAQRVIQGPAQTARDEIGQMVEQAAKSGPDVDIRTLKDEAMRIFQEEIRAPSTAFPVKPLEQAETRGARIAAPGEFGPGLSPAEVAKKRALAEEANKALAAAEEELAQTTLKHPAMRVVGRILNAEDTVPFAAAHQFKRELDDAIGTAWDRSVKSRVTNITKHLRTTLREGLRGHEPYNVATAAYETIAPLYTKGIAPRLRKVAEEAPEALVGMIEGSEPTRARMLRDLLVTQPAKVGEAPAGQAAWDGVRSAWTYERIVKTGPLETLGKRLDKLNPEFVEILYGDPGGQAVIGNLRSLSQAYQTALQSGKALVEATGEAGKAELRAARDTAATQLRQVRRAGRAGVAPLEADLVARTRARTLGREPTAQEVAFLKSKLGRAVAMAPGGGMGAETDVLRVILLNPTNPWFMTSLIRMLNAPSGKELVHWAALSSKSTQRLVGVLTSPYPGMAIADLLRAPDLGRPFIERITEHFLGDLEGPRPVPSHQIGAPPPARPGALIGSAPPR